MGRKRTIQLGTFLLASLLCFVILSHDRPVLSLFPTIEQAAGADVRRSGPGEGHRWGTCSDVQLQEVLDWMREEKASFRGFWDGGTSEDYQEALYQMWFWYGEEQSGRITSLWIDDQRVLYFDHYRYRLSKEGLASFRTMMDRMLDAPAEE